MSPPPRIAPVIKILRYDASDFREPYSPESIEAGHALEEMIKLLERFRRSILFP